MREIVLIICCIVAILLPICLVLYARSMEMYPIQPKKKKYNIQDEMSMFSEAKWVEKVIKSCKTYKQLIASRKLYRALSDKYNNKVDSNLLHRIDNNLYLVWYEMTDQVTYD